MLGLRQKLLLGFGGLLLIIVLIGTQSILMITDLGGAIDVILRENYRSVIACQKMKESLERMDSGVVRMLLDSEREGREAIDGNLALFDQALQAELHNITVQGEGENASHLQKLFAQYKTVIQKEKDESLLRGVRLRVYFAELLPLSQRIKDTTDTILNMNQQNMFEANQAARRKAAQERNQMYAFLLFGAAMAVLYMLLVGRWILRPIKRLIHSVDEITGGNLDIMVESDTRDEIGHLSAALNEMTTSLRELRRKDETRLFRIQHSTQQMFHNLSDVVAIVDPEGNVEMATETAQRIFNLKRSVRIQDLPFRWMNDLVQDALENDRMPSKEDKATVIQHFVDAEEHFFQPKAVPILNNQKAVTGVILILKDVTEQLQQDELKRGVISTVSHQLKTPLTSLRMAIYLLLEEKLGPLTPQQGDLLITAREDSERLCRILENLLDISRIVSGKMAMEFHAVPPDQMIRDASESFWNAALALGVKLHTVLPGDLPDVWVDRQQIGHVFANLLSNALKYTGSGGTVTLSAQADEGQVRFSVSDTGTGIPEEYLPRVFEQFFRIPEQEAQTGTGLGLAIVKEIIEAHGGTVSVESHEGQGSTFFFTLPSADRKLKEGAAHG